METAKNLTNTERRSIYRDEFRRVLQSFTPNCPGNRYSGAQVARAKGIARKNAMEIIDAITEGR